MKYVLVKSLISALLYRSRHVAALYAYVRACVHAYVVLTYMPTDSSRSHYSVLVRSMPDDYMNTVSQLERHLTGDHIGSILECTDVFTANQRILDCLTDQINTKEGLLDLCNWLSTITNVPELTAALKELRKGEILHKICFIIE